MKKIIFVTGTRADYGKIKKILIDLQIIKKFKVYLFVTGMHNLRRFGSTLNQIKKDKIKNIYVFNNQLLNHQKNKNQGLDSILAKTISGFGNFVKKISPDLIVVHGDRVETLACALSSIRSEVISGLNIANNSYERKFSSGNDKISNLY